MDQVTDTILSSPDFSEFLFNNLTSAIFMVDQDFHVHKVNRAFSELFNETDEVARELLCGNAIGCSVAVEQNAKCGDTTACANCDIRNSVSSCFNERNTIKSSYISRNFYINGKAETKYFRFKSKVASWNGTDFAIIAIDDITELEEQKKKIQDLADHDFLTGLNNRRHFFDMAENLFQNAKRGNITIAIAMFDIDHFKRINDAHGHAAGDFVLKSVSDILARNLRKADILARFGGEEFCLLLHCTGDGDAYTVVDKLRLLVEQSTFVYESGTMQITISAGLTSLMEESLDAMIQKADAMLYRAKETGRNRTEEHTVCDRSAP